MDPNTQHLERFIQLLGNRRAKALTVAILVVVVIVVLQVSNLKNNTPMCELLANCKLRNVDLHRMQIALSKSGLADFQIQEDRILVPQAKHAEYLQAISEQNAIPPELRSAETSAAVANPFLSRSQQVSIERDAKKRQIQEMVVRLPFVDQAWFEMDVPENYSAFTKSVKSAVVSIRPVEQNTLLDQQVETVRQMIGGAIAGIDPSQIVVIDLSTGFAHCHSLNNASFDREVDAQRAAFGRQQMLETKIRQALAQYPGVQVTVVIDNADNEDQIAQSAPQSKLANASQPVPTSPVAGANGQASIHDLPATLETDPQIELASHESIVPGKRDRICVTIEIPQELLTKIYGDPNQDRSMTTRSNVYQDILVSNESEKQFANLKDEIERIVRPLMLVRDNTEVLPINFNLIRQPVAPIPPWRQNLQVFARQNWPSAAVLLIGLILIGLVTQSGKAAWDNSNINPDIRIANTKSLEHNEPPDDNRRAAEVRLSRLIENDPEAAAKVIENWIRDAA